MRRSFALLAALGVLSAGRVALADPPQNDPALGRLSYWTRDTGEPVYPSSGLACGTMDSGYRRCLADNQLWANLINQYAGLMAPALMAPARTLGTGGLYVGYEPAIANVNANPDIGTWHRGTVGVAGNTIPGNGGPTALRQRAPDVLFMSRLHLRKGLPLGFELGLQTTFLHDSSLVMLGADIRWALWEGWRSGVGWLPDLAFRGSVNTLVGNPQIYLTVVSADVSISKGFILGGSAQLTPYVGAQGMFVFGDSQVVDGTLGRSAYGECPRTRIESGGSSGLQMSCYGVPNGVPNGAGVESEPGNNLVFAPVRILRWRGFGGLQFRYSLFTLTAEFGIDLTDPSFLNASNTVANQGRPTMDATTGNWTQQTPTFDGQSPGQSTFRQWYTSLGVGVTF